MLQPSAKVAGLVANRRGPSAFCTLHSSLCTRHSALCTAPARNRMKSDPAHTRERGRGRIGQVTNMGVFPLCVLRRQPGQRPPPTAPAVPPLEVPEPPPPPAPPMSPPRNRPYI